MADRRGGSLIGLLLAMGILVVIAAIGLNAISNSLTNTGPVSARSVKDQTYLSALVQALAAGSVLEGSGFMCPSRVTGSDDVSLNTTANLFSAMIAKSYAIPDQLISAHEMNANVWPDDDYDYTAHDPRRGVYWDPAFVADLALLSNDSFAHIPLVGRRLDRQWQFSASSRVPLIGTRGPADGVADPASYTYGPDGTWRGHVVFGDGHVEHLESFTPPNVVYDAAGERLPDNLYALETGIDGLDAYLAFTKVIDSGGEPVFQHD